MIAKMSFPVYATDSKGKTKNPLFFMTVEPNTLVLDTGETGEEYGQHFKVFLVSTGIYHLRYFKLSEACVSTFLAETS